MITAIRPLPTEPLRAEHRELLPNIYRLGEVADAVGDEDEDAVWAQLDEAYEFLRHHLLPHAGAEEAVLYPAVELAMRAPGAAATMSRDHVDVVARTDQLARELEHRDPIDRATARRLRSQLYGLEAVVALHFAKEEEVYLPILDAALDDDAAADLFRRLEASVER